MFLAVAPTLKPCGYVTNDTSHFDVPVVTMNKKEIEGVRFGLGLG